MVIMAAVTAVDETATAQTFLAISVAFFPHFQQDSRGVR